MASKSDDIRVGIIRCDLHAYWYAPFFETPDPALYFEVDGGCHYYSYRWDGSKRPRLRAVPGMMIAKVYDEEDRAFAERLSEVYHGRPKVCDSYEEVSDGVDLVFVADCSYEGKDHLRFATPGLKKGVTHFVDKPFAFTLKDARAMIEVAKRHRTAVMCSSLLRQSPFLRRFGTRLADIAPVSCLFLRCGGPSLAAIYHGLSAVQNVMGEGCEWAESMGSMVYETLRLHYPGPEGGTEVVLQNSRYAEPSLGTVYPHNHHHGLFRASAYGAGGAVHSPRVDDYLFPYSAPKIVRMAKRMAQTKNPPIPYDSMLELMEMIEAARLAHNKGKRVYLKDLR